MRWHLKHAVHGTKPRPVQVEAIKRAGGRPRYGQYLEQRLGKTSLALNEWWSSNCDICLVVAPNTFRMDWKYAAQEWGLDVWSGAWPRDPVPYDEDGALYSINYEAARTGGGRAAIEALLERRHCMLVLDETTSIKNPQSETAKAMINLAKSAIMVRELNGTPITQNVMDFYAQLRVLGELNGWNPYAFRNHFAVMGGYMGNQVTGMKNEEELYSILDRCSFRALRRDWLPGHRDATLIPVHLEMTDKQRRHYQEMMEDFFTMVDDVEVTAELVLTQMDKLRQISSGLIMSHGDVGWIEDPGKNPKIRAVLDIHGSGIGKTIVVHFYKPSGEALLAATGDNKLKLNPAVLRGGMKPEDLMVEKKRFNEDPDCRILIAQQTAACMGHTLTGDKDGINSCDRMIFFENSFGLRDRLQMQDRNYVEGRERGIYDLITSPMDNIAIGILSGKRDLANSIDDVVTAVRYEFGRK